MPATWQYLNQTGANRGKPLLYYIVENSGTQ